MYFYCSFLDGVGNAGEASQDFLELFQRLIDDNSGRWKCYLARQNILLRIGALITKVSPSPINYRLVKLFF